MRKERENGRRSHTVVVVAETESVVEEKPEEEALATRRLWRAVVAVAVPKDRQSLGDRYPRTNKSSILPQNRSDPR
jgi:hypothetical protein